MPGRTATFGTQYRFGFNGKENDNEAKGTGNQVDFGNRVFDPRISRWLSTDPLQAKYPNESPYIYTSNNPLFYKDPDGQDKIVSIIIQTDRGSYTVLRQVDKNYVGIRHEHYYSGGAKLQTLDHEITYTLDFRTKTDRGNRVRKETFDRVRETGFSAVRDYANFKSQKFSKSFIK